MEMPAVPGDPEAATGPGAVPRSRRSTREPGLRLLLLGKHGAGKSATGNSILGREAFASRFRAQAVTTECQSAHGTVRDTELVVIDTPDLFSSVSDEDQRGHLQRYAELSAPGPHALLLVICVGKRMTEDAETIHRAKCRFGREIGKHSIVVFTRKDELGEDSLDELVESDKALRALVQDCGGRYCAIDNKASGAERDAQVSELLCKVKGLVDQNGEQPYCLDLGKEHSELQDTMNERCDNSHGSEEMQLQSAGSELAPETSELRVLLVGKHGAGKSTVGNRLLGEQVFDTGFSEEPMTTKFQSQSRVWENRNILIIDSPDISSPDSFKREFQRPTLGDPHVILMVIPIGSYSEKDEDLLETLRRSFGNKIFEHMFILLTREEDRRQSTETLKARNHSLSKLLKECNDRYIFSNFKAVGEEEQQQVDQLLQELVILTQQNANKPCAMVKEGSEEMQLQSAGSELAPETSELRVLLVGKHGAGKSTVGNRLLGEQAFDTGFSEEPITTKFQAQRRFWKMRQILIIDTPDISSPDSFKGEFQRTTRGGPHVILMMIPKDSFSKKDEDLLETIRRSFGTKVFQHMFILLTREEDRCQSTKILKDRDDSLNSLLMKCKNKKFSYYKAVGEEEQQQVDQLLQELVTLMQQNANKPCAMVKEDTLSIVLVGRGGTGKSATGNTILRRTAFPSQLSARSVTKTCQTGKEKWGEQEVVVVDTPSLLLVPNDSEGPSQLEEEVRRCSYYCEGNRILFVLVFQLGRFTQVDQSVLVQLEKIFGEKVKEYTIVLFTRKEDLGGESIEDYLKNVDCKALKKTFEECGGRACAFSNRESGEAGETEVRALLTMANELIESHGGHGYPFILDEVTQRIKLMKSAQEKSKHKSQKQDSRNNLTEMVVNAQGRIMEYACMKLNTCKWRSTEHSQE